MKVKPASPNFDRVARIYRWAEYLALGSQLKRTREALLEEVTGARRALVLGDGDGRFAAALLGRAPGMTMVAVDSSAAMLRLLEARCHRAGCGDRLQTVHASVADLKTAGQHDLIVSHFLLDCLAQEEVDTVARQLTREAEPGCLWLLSDFGLPRGTIARMLSRGYIRLLYLAFRLLTGLRPQHLPDPQRALDRAGFQRVARRERMGGLLYTELWRLSGGR